MVRFPFSRLAYSSSVWAGVSVPAVRIQNEEGGGGGGSRTRVRKHVVVGLYMRVRFVIFMPGVWKRLSTARP